MNKKIIAAALNIMILAGVTTVTPIVSAAPPDAGADLNQVREQIERERIAQQIAEDREKAKNKVENESGKKDQSAQTDITFELNKIEVDASEILTADEIGNITKEYVGKKVSINDLYDVVKKINELYEKKGYITCRAYLPSQKIEDGVVKIAVIEGKTDNVELVNNKDTKSKYILNRIPLEKGKPADINKLNKDLLRFNATNDVQLRIVMKAGTKEGTTDYVIEAYEPKKHNFVLFADNAGNYSSGEVRGGLFYNLRSLSGVRDNLGIGYVFSQGTQAVSTSYSRNIGRSGTRLDIAYSTNAVKSVKNTDIYKTKGHANSYTIGFTQPLEISDKGRSELSLEYGHQDSKTDYIVDPLRFNLVADKTDDLTLGFAVTDYGKSHVFYQKHRLVTGHSKSTPTAWPHTSQNFFFYKLNSIYQKYYQHGQQLSLKFDAQWSTKDNLISSKAFFLGGYYSVRGYKENYLSGDSGIFASAEYQVPFNKERNINGFVFFDYGRIFGETAIANDTDRQLYSTGVGVRAVFDKQYSASLVWAFPLKKEFPSHADTVSSSRLHFQVSAQF